MGQSIINDMDGKSVSDHSFIKKKQAVTLAACTYVSVEGDKVEIDPKHLYQRMLIAGLGNMEPKEMFQYELCSYPSSLFESSLAMRTPKDKASLQNGLIKMAPQSLMNDGVDVQDMKHVVDGRYLLQRIPWPKCYTYKSLCDLYVEYVHRNIPNVSPLVVFDGYSSGPSTKDETHLIREGGVVGVDVEVDPNMILNMKKKLPC